MNQTEQMRELCPTCGEIEPRTGNCGTSDNDSRALCKKALASEPTPAVAVNEQLLEALKVALRIFGRKCFDATSLDWSIQAARAIRAAEAAKRGV